MCKQNKKPANNKLNKSFNKLFQSKSINKNIFTAVNEISANNKIEAKTVHILVI